MTPIIVLVFLVLCCTEAPKLSEAPGNVHIQVGQSFKLSCKVKANPPPFLSWLKDGREILTKQGDNEVFNFKVERAQKEDAGTYICQAQNPFGKTRGKAVVFVGSLSQVADSAKVAGSTIEAIQNSAIVLRCQLDGYPKPTITWSKGGRPLSGVGYSILQSGHLEISSVQYSDHGYFTCHANNGNSRATQRIQVVVKAPPLFKVVPEDLLVLESETASFHCKADGYPLPAIAWQKNGARLPADGRHVVLSSGTLRILSSRLSDVGVYECLAINVIGVNISRARLNVNRRVPPSITMYPEHTTVQAGNTIHFTCVADGAPQPVIVWIKDGVQVSSGNRVTTNATVGTLEMRDIGVIDAGAWECAARNSVGFSSKKFHLKVIGAGEQTFDGNQFVRPSFEQAKHEVNLAIEKTKENLNNLQPNHPGDLLALFRFPSAEAIEIARAAEIFEVALSIIQAQVDAGNVSIENGTRRRQHFNSLVSPDHVQLLANLSGCTAHRNIVNCSDTCFHRSFRNYDGSCNNFKHPMHGASLTPFRRLLSPIYENGFNTPVGWNGSSDSLPSARLVSMEMVSTVNTTDDPIYTHMLMQWGQFLDHDLDLTVASPSSSTFKDGIPCHNTCENKHPCFPIGLPYGDRRLKKHKCMEFTRSSAVCGSGSTSLFFGTITPRQQINQITAYLDASNVYGSSEKDAQKLRQTGSNRGFLRTSDGPYKAPFMPFNKDTPIDCQMNKSHSHVPCFLAGDHRANEHLGLLAMHTVWVREHNRIASELGKLNPSWSGERVFQEARKIVGAQMQHITYTEFLPKILGKRGMDLIGTYTSYKPDVDASIFNSFATAAYRFGHTLVQPILKRLNASMLPTEHGHLPLHKAFFSPYRLVEEGGIDPILRGMYGSPAKSRLHADQLVTTELTDHLFEMAHTIALDLAAINVQRGRDHGIPGYNSWRQFCNMTVASDMNDLKLEIPDLHIRNVLRKLYGTPDKIDLWIGGIAEQSLPGSRLGPLFTCLIALQFQRVRDGDRLWYENPATFRPDQLEQIRQASLSRVLCDNADEILSIQRDAFNRVTSDETMIPCSSLPQLDLRYWKQCHDHEECQAVDFELDRNNIGTALRRQPRKINAIVRREKAKQPQSDLEKLNQRLNVVHGALKSLAEEMKDLYRSQSSAATTTIANKLDCVDEELRVRRAKEAWTTSRGKSCLCEEGVLFCT